MDCAYIASRFPRTRGDVPRACATWLWAYSLPPHSRGCTWYPSHSVAIGRASPALAGMYPVHTYCVSTVGSFPRTRGDVPLEARASTHARLLPPHSRGCTAFFSTAGAVLIASPALAGMYPWPAQKAYIDHSLPRTRGDVPNAIYESVQGSSLPPHSRGCPSISMAGRIAREAWPVVCAILSVY